MAKLEFTYKASGTRPDVQEGMVEIGDLDKLTAIGDMLDMDSGVRFFHDGNGTLYYVKLNEKGEIAVSGGKADLKAAKSGLKMQDGENCSIFTEGATLLLAYSENDRETLGSENFELNNGDVKTAEAGPSVPAAEETSDGASETAGETSAAEETSAAQQDSATEASETEAETSEEAAETSAAETEAQGFIATAAPREDAEDSFVVTEALTEIPAVPQTDSGAGNGVLGWAIGATVAAVALAAVCAVLAKKMADGNSSRKLKDTELKSLQRSVEDKTSAYNKGQDRIHELEKELRESREEIASLQDAAKASEAQAASERELLERRPSEEALQEATAKAERLQREYDELYLSTRSMQREKEQLEERIRELEQRSAAVPEQPEEPETAPEETAVDNAEPDAFLISTSETALEKYKDLVYVAPTGSVVADEAVLNRAPFRRASLVVIGEKAYLNPYFFRSLSSGLENYSNLAGLRSVFDIDGLGSSAVKYRLIEIVPAQVSLDEAANAYHLVQKGKLTVRIG
ncbi:MAG: hypothetical protein IKN55_06280 [Oscillospiraceae bacterium]|nr:hypothetical protein [Oscillospiraceae bacterium]